MRLSESERALVLAMELLRKALGDNSLAVAANTQSTEEDFRRRAEAIGDFVAGKSLAPDAPRGEFGQPSAPAAARQPAPTIRQSGTRPARPARAAPRGGALGNALVAVLSQVAGKFGALLGPSALLTRALESQASGFQVLGSATKVVGSVIGGTLLPFTVLLSAGVLALSDVMMTKGMPIMERFFVLILSQGIPLLEFLLDTVDDAATGVQDFADAVLDAVNWINRQINRLNPFSDDNSDERTIGGLRWSGRTTRDSVDQGLTDTLRSLRASMGPKPQITGVADVGRQVQSAVNADPIEMKIYNVNQQMLSKLEQIAEQQRGGRRATPQHPPNLPILGPILNGMFGGEWSGGAGGGGDYGGDF